MAFIVKNLVCLFCQFTDILYIFVNIYLYIYIYICRTYKFLLLSFLVSSSTLVYLLVSVSVQLSE